jgi:hypothetical protein
MTMSTPRRNRLSNWQAKLKAQNRIDEPGPKPKDARFAGAVEDAARCRREKPQGSVLIGVEFEQEYLNAVLRDFAGLEQTANAFGTVVVRTFLEEGSTADPRNAAQSWVLDRMRAKTYADNDAVVATIAWLAITHPHMTAILKAPSARTMIDELRFVVTDTGMTDPKLGKEINWRLFITFSPSREELCDSPTSR